MCLSAYWWWRLPHKQARISAVIIKYADCRLNLGLTNSKLVLCIYILLSNSCKNTLFYSWHFSCYSAPIHWLVHGHMTSNSETVSCQMPWTGNIVKTVTSNRKQFTLRHEMLTAVARDRWNLSKVFKSCFCFVLVCNKSLNDRSLGEQWILFPENLDVRLGK